MEEITYIHVSDVRMEAPFVGIARGMPRAAQLGGVLHAARSRALDNLIRLCEKEKPDFLLFTGDICDDDTCSLHARLEIRDIFQRLETLGVQVFMSAGASGASSSGFKRIDWPKNVTIFGSDPQICEFVKNGAPAAILHHFGDFSALKKVGAPDFPEPSNADCFQLGVLDGELVPGGDEAAVEAMLDALRELGMDAWALAHSRNSEIVRDHPFVACPGPLQGLNMEESGPHGCFLLRAARYDGEWRCEASFIDLAPVIWENAEISIEGLESMERLEKWIADQLEEYRAGAEKPAEALLFGIRLTGAGMLDFALRKPGEPERLAASLGYLAQGKPGIWIKDFQIDTHAPEAAAESLRRDDLAGEVNRTARRLMLNAGELDHLGDEALAPLFSQVRFRNILPPPDSGQLKELLARAQVLCQDLLEKR